MVYLDYLKLIKEDLTDKEIWFSGKKFKIINDYSDKVELNNGQVISKKEIDKFINNHIFADNRKVLKNMLTNRLMLKDM
jgi:hypothetical protein